ncbi:hypothetical protein SCUCBS95973_007422 [Sporothrix curviconia]|uniref:Uncharacterized protein n=1 Tax=Sporothrix curviconia TaxID=1260050 RepID=A0ABP0CDK8_9PEZI
MTLVILPTVPATSQTARHRGPHPSTQQPRCYVDIASTIIDVRRKFVCLAGLGRAGQWVLHQDRLYDPKIDTRPQLRGCMGVTEIPLRSVTVCGIPLPDHTGLIWAGPWAEQIPNFQDIAFWQEKRDELSAKIEEVQAHRVHPRFTEDELQTLEALEQQPGHFFRVERVRRQKQLASDKVAVFNILFQLAKRGRPGQWILHCEDLYHPAIDTRSNSRQRPPEKNVVLRDEVFSGQTGQTGQTRTVESREPLELAWRGQGPAPDPDDVLFWQTCRRDLSDKLSAVEKGRVDAKFTAKELQTLSALESDTTHLFHIYAREREAKSKVPQVAETAVERDARAKLWMAKYRVVSAMERLGDSGLAGMWVLHHEEIYLTAYDTHFRDNDFNNVSYWDEKLVYLEQLAEDIARGHLTAHRFSPGELMRITLLERTIEYNRAAWPPALWLSRCRLIQYL